MEIDFEQVRRAFVAETEEDLATIEQLLLRLEKAPQDAEAIAGVFRKFHTLKGNANALELGHLGEFAHRVEDVFDGLRAGRERVTPGLVSYLLRVLDIVRAMIPDALAGRDVPVPAPKEFLRRIEGGRFQEEREQTPAEGVEPLEVTQEGSGTLRIEVGKLDDLLRITSEIAVARGRLELLIEREGTPEIAAAYRAVERLLTGLHHSVGRVRMVPIGPLLRRQQRLVRDLALALHKQAELVVFDQGVEVDNSVIEQLRAPLMHMVRNAVHHGLESPEERQRVGKRAVGRIELRARHEASDIVIEVQDDGRGLDRARLLERARALGIVAESAGVGDREIDRLVFSHGLSTAGTVTETSGRGVGLDIVHRQVDALGGSVEIENRPGEGASFVIRMPLTLAVIEGLVGRVGERAFVIPMAGVVRCLDLDASAVAADEGVLNVRGHAVPFARLRSLFGVEGAGLAREVAVVIQRGSEQVALAVDQLLGRAHIVVKAPGRFFRGLPAVSGLTILGDGQVAPILNVSGLMQEHARRLDARRALTVAGGA